MERIPRRLHKAELPFSGDLVCAICRHVVAGPQELVHFFVRVDFICALQWHPTQLVAGRRVQCPASNSMGRVVGPLSAVSGFHGAGPVRRALGMRRVITARASANSRRGRWATRQYCMPAPNVWIGGAPTRLMSRRSGSSQTAGSRLAAPVLTTTIVSAAILTPAASTSSIVGRHVYKVIGECRV